MMACMNSYLTSKHLKYLFVTACVMLIMSCICSMVFSPRYKLLYYDENVVYDSASFENSLKTNNERNTYEEGNDTHMKQSTPGPNKDRFSSQNPFMINCGNVDEITIIRGLGHGNKKVAYLGSFHGIEVVVKVLRYNSSDIRKCEQNKVTDSIEELSIKKQVRQDSCYNFAYLMALQEILLHSQLQHPGIVKLLGYCAKNILDPPEKHQTVTERGVVSVFEFGKPYLDIKIKGLSERLRVVYQLADVLDYFANSPLGSLYMEDLVPINAVMIDGQFKLSDIDLLRGGKEVHCPWCKETNARTMMNKATEHFFKPLLSDSSGDLPGELGEILSELKSDFLTAAQLKRRILRFIDNQLDRSA